jgi:hypothetical protein
LVVEHLGRCDHREVTESGGGGAMDRVWIFHGENAEFASGVFHDKDSGLGWVGRHRLTGILAEYHVGDGCYDLALREGRFHKRKPHRGSPEHVARFSPGLEHIHVRDGRPDV